jgi:hypothetical protein
MKAMDLEELPKEWQYFIYRQIIKEIEKEKKKKRRK